MFIVSIKENIVILNYATGLMNLEFFFTSYSLLNIYKRIYHFTLIS